MSSAARIVMTRHSPAAAVLRTLSRRTATGVVRCPTGAAIRRRGYASAHGAATASSDLPWLAGAVGVTVAGMAFLLSGSGSSSNSHGGGHHGDEHHKASDSSNDKHGEKEDSSDDSESKSEDSGSDSDSNPDSKSESSSKSRGGAKDPSNREKASQAGQNVPPASADNSDLAEKWDEKKQRHEEYKKMTSAKDTRTASSSSEVPSKKTAAEDPREDPKKGEGEGAKKGSPEN